MAPAMPNIYEYTNYRLFLKGCYEKRKAANPHFSYRYMAQKVGFKSAGHFTLIVQGKTNISALMVSRFIQFLGLKRKEAEYFEILVNYEHAATHDEKKRYFERMLKFVPPSVRSISKNEYEFCQKWFYSVVREILTIIPFVGNLQDLASKIVPPISIAEARKAVELLEALGMVRKQDDGSYVQSEALLSAESEGKNIAMTDFALQALDLAKNAVATLPKEERSISGVILSLSDDAYELLLEEIKSFRKRVMQIAGSVTDPTRVYNFTMQLVPVSRRLSADREERGCK